MRTIYKAILIIILFNNCIAFTSEDFAKENLSDKKFPLKIHKIVQSGLDSSFQDLKFDNLELSKDEDKDTYILELNFNLPKDYEESTGTLITIVSLGIAPYFITKKGTIDVKIYNSNSIILKKNLAINMTIAYGWLPVLLNSYITFENAIPINEGTGIYGAFINTIQSRLISRLTRIIIDEKLKE